MGLTKTATYEELAAIVAARVWGSTNGPFVEDQHTLWLLEDFGWMLPVKVTRSNFHDYEDDGWEVGDTVYEWSPKAVGSLYLKTPQISLRLATIDEPEASP